MTEEGSLAIAESMLGRDAFSRWLGIKILSVTLGRAELQMVVRNDMLNGFGNAHGAITFALADSAVAFAANSRGKVTVSVESLVSYPAPVANGDILVAIAEERSVGNRLAFYDACVTKQDTTIVAMFRGTLYRTGSAYAKAAEDKPSNV
jgi:acyl-CoA thioesterase